MGIVHAPSAPDPSPLNRPALTRESSRAAAGYYLFGFSLSVLMLCADGNQPGWVALINSISRGFLLGLFHVIVLGLIWVYLGTRVLRGSVTLLQAIQGSGLALFFPGCVLAVVAVVEALAAPHLASLSRIVAAFAGLTAVGVSAARRNHFGPFRDLAFLLWLPFAAVVLGILLALLMNTAAA